MRLTIGLFFVDDRLIAVSGSPSRYLWWIKSEMPVVEDSVGEVDFVQSQSKRTER